MDRADRRTDGSAEVCGAHTRSAAFTYLFISLFQFDSDERRAPILTFIGFIDHSSIAFAGISFSNFPCRGDRSQSSRLLDFTTCQEGSGSYVCVCL